MAADLSSDAGWAEAVKGCEFAQYVASPFPGRASQGRDGRSSGRRVTGAARPGSWRKAAGVKRVVMTSSMAAIAYGHGEGRAEVFWTRDDVVEPGRTRDNTPYTKSKTLAEKAAWTT